MALINFDCPECGHNLEVDEGGAGFIVKCPECGNPLQIPDLPRSRRYRKIAVAIATFLAIVFLFAVNLLLWSQKRDAQQQVADLQPLGEALQRAQGLSMQQEGEIAKLKKALSEVKVPEPGALADAALDAIEEAESLARELESALLKLLENSTPERSALLREDMRKRVDAAKNGLPAPPILTDAGPGRGIQGRQIVFPVLPGPEGQTLRENAEVIGVDGDKVSVKFPGGTATYALTELHPGVAAFLPVDPLLVLPRKQWSSEVVRIQQTINARRDQRLAQLRAAIQAQLPPEEMPKEK
jgi:hypothetical protein